MVFVPQPALALRHIGPCADICQSFRQCVDIAVIPINPRDLQREPVFLDMADLVQVGEDPHQQTGMFAFADSAKVRNPADIPQKPHRRPIRCPCGDQRVRAQRPQGGKIVTFAHAGQPVVVGPRLEGLQQSLHRSELQVGIAPLQLLHRLELVAGDLLHHAVVELEGFARHTECARLQMPSRPPGDLCQLVRPQIPHPVAIEL